MICKANVANEGIHMSVR